MIRQVFQIHVPDSSITDLRERLARARWPDEINGMGWGQGTDLSYLQELVAYWLDEFDWRSQENRLNQLDQYVSDVEGTRIHYLHIRGKGPKPTPLIVTHGWPGSFLEMEKVIPLLTDPVQFGGSPEDAFDVVVPSVPGFGFSERPIAVGMNPQRVARIWNSLMHGLGYEQYAAQGGDIGAGISTWLGYDYPESVIGIHLNYIPGAYERGPGSQPLTAAEKEFLSARESWLREEGGYWHIQATKPQTLAFGLNDSPIGPFCGQIPKSYACSAPEL